MEAPNHHPQPINGADEGEVWQLGDSNGYTAWDHGNENQDRRSEVTSGNDYTVSLFLGADGVNSNMCGWTPAQEAITAKSATLPPA